MDTSAITWLRPAAGGVVLSVKLVPRSPVSRVDGPHGDALKIRLNAPPVDGKANAALLRFLADTLDLPMAAVTLRTGETSRQKTIHIHGLDAATVASRLTGPAARG